MECLVESREKIVGIGFQFDEQLSFNIGVRTGSIRFFLELAAKQFFEQREYQMVFGFFGAGVEQVFLELF